MNTIKRIKQFIDYKGLTNKKFEELVGFSNGAFSSQLKNNKTIGVDKLENILFNFPEINIEWLLTGIGEMLKNEESNKENIKSIDNKYLEELINTQKDLIENQKKYIEKIEKELKEIKSEKRSTSKNI